MTADASEPSRARKIWVKIGLGLLGAAVGGAIGYWFPGEDLSWQDLLAHLAAIVLLVSGVSSVFVLWLRPALIPKGCGVLQITVLLLSGGMFLAPIYAPEYAPPNVVFAAVVAVLVLQSVANLMLWRLADEMYRRVMMESCAIAFWASQLALFLYAAAERMQLVPTVTSWPLMSILMLVYIAASMIAQLRRGIG